MISPPQCVTMGWYQMVWWWCYASFGIKQWTWTWTIIYYIQIIHVDLISPWLWPIINWPFSTMFTCRQYLPDILLSCLCSPVAPHICHHQSLVSFLDLACRNSPVERIEERAEEPELKFRMLVCSILTCFVSILWMLFLDFVLTSHLGSSHPMFANASLPSSTWI